MNNCFVNVCGGVGNQLFQVANGYAYSKRHAKELYINPHYWSASQGVSPDKYQDTIFQKFNYLRTVVGDNQSIIDEYSNEKYIELPYVIGNVFLNGYFQSLKYFEDYSDEFKNIILNSLPDVRTDYNNDKYVAFHIRRGDYLQYKNIHYVCDTEYFKKMFEEFKGCEIHVFTDSPDFIIEEFNDFDYYLVKTSSELHDLTFMINHGNIVCSNSSFSWWASFLGNYKKIIVPDRWYSDGRFCEDIYRKDMIKFHV